MKIIPLTEELSKKYINEIIIMANLIPLVEYFQSDILSDKKGERELFGKWEHSLICLEGDKPIGIIIGYERKSEKNEHYPCDTIYISELAVKEDSQGKGIGRKLIDEFLEYNKKIGMAHLDGPINFSVQTNAAEWNNHVIGLYESFGFKERARKEYDNRTDVVMGLEI